MPQQLFEVSLRAISLMSNGNYAAAIEELNLGGIYSQAQLKRLLEDSFKKAGHIQTETAVIWSENGFICLAYPLTAPDEGNAQTVLFSISSEYEFLGMSLIKWSDAVKNYEMAENIIWLSEYKPSFMVFAD
ncbi:MAG: hypothetical protein IKR85_11855 [Clostridia bacterium]|nr:hypothetical protein [Clostridia bacterium]